MIYYYSLSGHCEELSGKIADRMDCERERIIEKKKRLSKGFLRFLNGSAAVQKTSADIDPVKNEPGQFDRIVIITPFWAASPTPAIRGFLDRYHQDLKGKKLGLVVTNLGSDPDVAFTKYEELFPEPLVKKSFTKAKGEWADPKEEERINEFISEFDAK
jgi:flavodoxin